MKIGKVWLQMNINLADYDNSNVFLTDNIKPFIEHLYTDKLIDSWHYFREPYICLRILSSSVNMQYILYDLLELLIKLKKIGIALNYTSVEYNGESEFYGDNVWELIYKQWEAMSNLSLELCSNNPHKDLPFYLARIVHLAGNQLGFTIDDEVEFSIKWGSKLINANNEEYSSDIKDKLSQVINGLKKHSNIKGL
jgi:hypothetical protein